MDIKQSVQKGFVLGKTYAFNGMMIVAALSLLKESPSCLISAGAYCASFTTAYVIGEASQKMITIDQKVALFVLSFGLTTILSPHIAKHSIKYSMSYRESGLYGLIFTCASIVELETIKEKLRNRSRWTQV